MGVGVVRGTVVVSGSKTSNSQTVRPHGQRRDTTQQQQASNARQALDPREHSTASQQASKTARPPVCSWERSNGLAALGTATINLAGASASRVARLPFYHRQQPARCSVAQIKQFSCSLWYKQSSTISRSRLLGECVMCDEKVTTSSNQGPSVSPSHAPSAASLTPLLDYIHTYSTPTYRLPVPPSHRALPTPKAVFPERWTTEDG